MWRDRRGGSALDLDRSGPPCSRGRYRGRIEQELVRPRSATAATTTKSGPKTKFAENYDPGDGRRDSQRQGRLAFEKAGRTVALDDPLCEVETDKAVYPIESSFAGTMGEWKTEIGAMVDIGQEIGTILAEGDSFAEQFDAAAEASAHQPNGELASVSTPAAKRRLPPESAAIEPALSPTIIRRLGRVVPANLQIDARWDAIRGARETAKKRGQECSVALGHDRVGRGQGDGKHAPFRRVILDDDRIVEHDEFDLGVAVALDDGRLATAVVTRANKRDWPDFVQRYNQTVEETRGGRVDAMNAPIVIRASVHSGFGRRRRS